MEKLIWNDSLSVGSPEIDHQHQQLVQMLNQMIGANDLTVGSELISDTLTRMTEYTDYHFTAEEDLMQAHDYPDLEAHRLQHHEFMRKTAELSVAAMDHDYKIPDEILDYLKNWLVEHIMKSDMLYKPYLAARLP
jgi:hemerythrin-like metal-binding protein